MKSYTCEVIEDPYNEGDLLLSFNDELMEEMGWGEGDTLMWSINEDGNVTLRRKDDV